MQRGAWRGWAALATAAAITLMIPAESAGTSSAVDSLAATPNYSNHNHSHQRHVSWRHRTRQHTTTRPQAPQTTAPEATAPQTTAPEAPQSEAITTVPAVTTPTAAEAVFDLSALSVTEAEWARSVLNTQCTFDWSRLTARMGGGRVRVELGTPPARGMYYPSERRLQVHRNFYDLQRTVASRVLAWEAAHVADIYGLSEDQHRQISALYHTGGHDDHGWFTGAYEDQVGEAFMEGFVAAYCPGLQASPYFNHVTTPEIAAGIRQIIG